MKAPRGQEDTLKIVINDTCPGSSTSTMNSEKHEASYRVAKTLWAALAELHRFVEALIVSEQPHGIEFKMILKVRDQKHEYAHYESWDPDGLYYFDGYKATRHSVEQVAATLVKVAEKWIAETADDMRRDAVGLRDALRAFRAREQAA